MHGDIKLIYIATSVFLCLLDLSAMPREKPFTVFRQLLPYSDREEDDGKIRLLRYKYLSFTQQHVELVALLNSVRIMGTKALLPGLTKLITVRDAPYAGRMCSNSGAV